MYQDGSNLHIAVLLSNHGIMCHAMTHDPAVIGHSEDNHCSGRLSLLYEVGKAQFCVGLLLYVYKLSKQTSEILIHWRPINMLSPLFCCTKTHPRAIGYLDDDKHEGVM